jgi:hypothetical protein
MFVGTHKPPEFALERILRARAIKIGNIQVDMLSFFRSDQHSTLPGAARDLLVVAPATKTDKIGPGLIEKLPKLEPRLQE